jgi:hypothetical protein
MSSEHTILLRKLLLTSGSKSRLYFALATLALGTTLLLLSVLTWWNFNQLVGGTANSANTNTCLVIGKQITDHNMGQAAANTFSASEVTALGKVSGVVDIGVVSAAAFPAYAVLDGNISMSTEMPLESVPDRFLDTIPDGWNWQPGDRYLPVILSAQFLDIYNYVFAPGQGLPQLSRSSVKSVALKLRIGGADGMVLSAHVVGFSDNINSVLVPPALIGFGNRTYAHNAGTIQPSQLVVKVTDPTHKAFTSYLQQHGYTTNAQNGRWAKIRAIVEVVSLATGLLAVLLMGISMIVFILFVQLMLTRAAAAINLLWQLGYGFRYLYKFTAKQILPLAIAALCIAPLLSIVAQLAIAGIAKENGIILPSLPGWQVWMVFAISCTVLLWLLSNGLKKALQTEKKG